MAAFQLADIWEDLRHGDGGCAKAEGWDEEEQGNTKVRSKSKSS